MTLYTSYLGNYKNIPSSIVHLYIMRGRGNNEVAPSKELLQNYKAGHYSLKRYFREYEKLLWNKPAYDWMKRIAEMSKEQDVVLICFEIDPKECHRGYLSKRIKDYFPFVQLGGELPVLNKTEENNDEFLGQVVPES